MQAIETIYKGYRFRSRLEAPWAVFLDALGFKWDYEPECFDLGKAGWYLPDFWLPGDKMWAEVKPVTLTNRELSKARQLALDSATAGSAAGVLLLVGIPENKTYALLTYQHLDDGRARFKRFLASFPVERIERAVIAARQARFEFGQFGAPSEWTHNG